MGCPAVAWEGPVPKQFIQHGLRPVVGSEVFEGLAWYTGVSLIGIPAHGPQTTKSTVHSVPWYTRRLHVFEDVLLAWVSCTFWWLCYVALVRCGLMSDTQ